MGAMPLLVNGELLTDEVINREVERLERRPEWKLQPKDSLLQTRLRSAAEQRAVDEILFLQAIKAHGVVASHAAVDAEVTQIRQRSGCRFAFDDSELRAAVTQRHQLESLVTLLSGPVPEPSSSEMAAVYDQGKIRWALPEMVQVSQVVKQFEVDCTEKEAAALMTRALAEAKRGTRFREIVWRYSDCKSDDGILDFFPRGVMVPEFENAVFSLQIGQLTSVFQTPFGFHIAQMKARRTARQRRFEEVRSEIRQVLLLTAHRRAVANTVQILRRNADVRRVTIE